MKKLTLLFIITIIVSSQLFSQTYRKLVEEGKIWSVYTEGIDDISSYWITFGSDSVINEKIYKKVISGGLTYGFIREDNAQKVYFMNNALEEGLLYDFDVNIGDTVLIVNTFSWTNCLEDLTAVVDTIFYSKSLTITNNCEALPDVFNTSFLDDSERKIIIVRKIDSENQLDYWIEGIGSVSGVLESGGHFIPCLYCDMFFMYKYLLCYFENSEQVYGLTELYSWCNVSINIVENLKKKLSVYPNPVTSNVFTVEFESPFSGNIILVNAIGNTVLNKEVDSHATSITINLPNIPKGLYFLIATDFSGNTNTSKIIIN